MEKIKFGSKEVELHNAEDALHWTPPEGKIEYWVSFERERGAIGTWSDYAVSADAFIQATIEVETKRAPELPIRKFLELREYSTSTWGGKQLSTRKYNQQLKHKKGD